MEVFQCNLCKNKISEKAVDVPFKFDYIVDNPGKNKEREGHLCKGCKDELVNGKIKSNFHGKPKKFAVLNDNCEFQHTLYVFDYYSKTRVDYTKKITPADDVYDALVEFFKNFERDDLVK